VKLKNRGIHSDSFANYLVIFFKKKRVIRAKDICDIINTRIIKELDSIRISK